MTESPVVLQQTIEELEAQLKQARELLAVKREEGKEEVIALVREVIADNGYEVNEIVDLLKPQKTVATRQKKPRVQLKDTVTGNIYKGGKFPRWLEDQLAATGLEYAGYKEQHMELVV